MSDNYIKVTVTGNKSKSVSVKSTELKNQITAGADMSIYYSNKAKEWAISDKLVDNEDYSSKYHANLAKGYTEEGALQIAEITTLREQTLADIDSVKTLVLEDISTQETQTINNIKETADVELDKIIGTGIDSRADIDLSNLSEEGEKHFLGKSQITNCITEIPQRTKADVTDGTLTVYAGTVAIVPYGIKDLRKESYSEIDLEKPDELYSIGDTFIHENFKIVDMQFTRREDTEDNPNPDNEGQFFVWVQVQEDIQNNVEISDSLERLLEVDLTINNFRAVINTISSSTEYTGTANCTNYRTDLNLVQYHQSGASQNSVVSLPILKVKSDGTYVYSSISQTFNGIGYIGSTWWLEKGYKGLISNGKNADRTLKNIEWNNDKLTMWTFDSSKNYPVAHMAYAHNVGRVDYMISDWTFDELANMYKYQDIGHYPWIDLGTCTVTAGVISNFNPKQPVRLLDGSGNITVRGLVKSVASVADFRLQTTKGDITTLSDNIPENESNIFGQVVYTDKNNGLMGYQRIHHNVSDQLNLQTAVRRMVNGVAKSAITSLMVGADGTQYFNFPHCKIKATTTSTASANNVAVIVQNYKNGQSWYRVWSDGWIEQGLFGNPNIALTLPKSFSDTTYTVVCTRLHTTGFADTSMTVERVAKNQIKIHSGSGNDTQGRLIYACGY